MKGQKYFFGNDALANLQREIHQNSYRRVLLLRGKLSYEVCGAKMAFCEIFSFEQCQVTEWRDFQENPKIEDVERGLQLLQSKGADVIVAVGGGSVIDMAKLIRFHYSYSGDLTGKDFIRTKDLIPLMAVPTTAGTGSEATHFAVCYKNKVKYSVEHDDILPDVACVYPQFTYSNSPYLTACTGFDALAQAIESYWNKNATTESERYAIQALEKLWHPLGKLSNGFLTEGDRDSLAEGAYWAGRAINITKTTAPHAFSYAFTTFCSYPHGHAVALTFPFFMDLNCNTNVSKDNHYKINKLLDVLGMDRDTCKNKMQTYIECIGLKYRGTKGLPLRELLDQVNLQRLGNNPVPVDQAVIDRLEIFLET